VTTKPDDRERRLATIFAADIVGYSRLMDADEEGTYAALVSARSEIIEPKIAKHKARIVKHTGDGFLAEFPTVLSAVKFAMQLQEEMGRRAKDVPDELKVKFRIGINLGDIIVDDTGDIFGDGVNVAARLETLGIPGGICISAPVYESIHKKLDVKFDDLGGQKVKNISTPIHAYDIRWKGEAGKPDERVGELTSKPKPLGLIAGGAVAAAALIGIVIWQIGGEPGADISPQSVAVLPFINMSSDLEQEYFSDGITEEILDELTQLEGLKVTARTSAFSFKGKNIPIPEIAETLGVANILEGSVRKAGNRVRITAQLIHADDGFHMWSETYDRDLTDIFAVQDEISGNIASVLEVQLLGGDETADVVDKSQTTNPEAYTLFLQARFLGRQLTPEALGKSIALFEQALAIDPDYAAAWTGLAGIYANQATQGLRPFDESYKLARQAANRALALDPDYALVHSNLGDIALSYDRDLAAATRHYERALVIEPANTDSIIGAARLALALGRMDQAIALGEYAAARDPVNPEGNLDLGFIYFHAGRLDEAIASARTTLSLSPGYIGAQIFIGTALLQKGEPQAALEAIQKEVSGVWRLIGLVMAHHALGDAAASDVALAELIEKYEQEAAFNIAYVLAYRGEADRAFEWLDKPNIHTGSLYFGFICNWCNIPIQSNFGSTTFCWYKSFVLSSPC
jgi:TolB-like protein/class 3 adenylate cyclase/Flp pilus assembly protein TadD